MKHHLKPWTAAWLATSLCLAGTAAFAADAVTVSPLLSFTDAAGSFPGGTSLAPPVYGKTEGKTRGKLYGAAYETSVGGGKTYGHFWSVDPKAADLGASYQREQVDTYYSSAGISGGLRSTLTEDSEGNIFVGAANSLTNWTDSGGWLARLTDATGAVKYTRQSGLDSTGAIVASGKQDTNIAGTFFYNPLGQMASDDAGNTYFFATGIKSGPINLLVRRDKNGNYTVLRDTTAYPLKTDSDVGTYLYTYGGVVIYSKADNALYAAIYVSFSGTGNTTGSRIVKIDLGNLDTTAGNTTLTELSRDVTMTMQAGGHILNSLVEVGNWLYGIADNRSSSAAQGEGKLWRVRKNGTGFAVVKAFSANPRTDSDLEAGSVLYGPLALGLDGNIYGTSLHGGLNATTAKQSGDGTLFRVVVGSAEDHGNDVFEQLHKFAAATEGRMPLGLTVGEPGVLYGATSFGGANDVGTVFKVTYPLPQPAFTADLTASAISVTAGDSITLSWATTHTGACTAGGSNGSTWSGAKPTSGNAVSVGPLSVVGNSTFTLTCGGTYEGSPEVTKTVTVAVAAKPSNDDGGGGAFDWTLLAGLGAILSALNLRYRAGRRSSGATRR